VLPANQLGVAPSPDGGHGLILVTTSHVKGWSLSVHCWFFPLIICVLKQLWHQTQGCLRNKS